MAIEISGCTTREYYNALPSLTCSGRSLWQCGANIDVVVNHCGPALWKRPIAAFLRGTDDQRWENYRQIALAELDEEFPTETADAG